MADEADMDNVEDTTEPSMDLVSDVTDTNDEAVYKLHEEIDNLNLVLDHLERKNGDIYSRVEELLAAFKQNKTDGK